MENYTDFKPEDELHITSFRSTTIREIANIIQGCFGLIDKFDVKIESGLAKDSVQLDKRNSPSAYILDWWVPKILDRRTAPFIETRCTIPKPDLRSAGSANRERIPLDGVRSAALPRELRLDGPVRLHEPCGDAKT